MCICLQRVFAFTRMHTYISVRSYTHVLFFGGIWFGRTSAERFAKTGKAHQEPDQEMPACSLLDYDFGFRSCGVVQVLGPIQLHV